MLLLQLAEEVSPGVQVWESVAVARLEWWAGMHLAAQLPTEMGDGGLMS